MYIKEYIIYHIVYSLYNRVLQDRIQMTNPSLNPLVNYLKLYFVYEVKSSILVSFVHNNR